MLQVDDIDYMIATLTVARKELEYKKQYNDKEKNAVKEHKDLWLFRQYNRRPKDALICDSLKNVARLARVGINDMKRGE